MFDVNKYYAKAKMENSSNFVSFSENLKFNSMEKMHQSTYPKEAEPWKLLERKAKTWNLKLYEEIGFKREKVFGSTFDLPSSYVVEMNLEKLYASKLNAYISVKFKVQLRNLIASIPKN